MLFDTVDFNAMTSSSEALWLKQKVILQNIANYETPNYKAKTVTFEDALKNAREKDGTGRYNFKANIEEDETLEVRTDGNNVNLEVENIELFRTYVQSAALYQKISGQFTNFRYVLNNAFK